MEKCPKCGSKKTRAETGKSPREKEIEGYCIGFLEQLGFEVWKTSQYGKPKGMTPGLSDLIAFGYGMCLFVEVKTRTGRQSKDQRAFQKAVEKNGGVYLMPRSLDELREMARDLISGSGGS